MADAHAKHHDYHLVDPSPWPVVGATSIFITAVGAIMWMKNLSIGGAHYGPYLAGAGVIGIVYTMIAWWNDVIHEAQDLHLHTRVVQLHHRYGMMMFIASEVMFATFFPIFCANNPRKCWASTGTSPGRSRSGGSDSVITFSR